MNIMPKNSKRLKYHFRLIKPFLDKEYDFFKGYKLTRIYEFKTTNGMNITLLFNIFKTGKIGIDLYKNSENRVILTLTVDDTKKLLKEISYYTHKPENIPQIFLEMIENNL